MGNRRAFTVVCVLLLAVAACGADDTEATDDEPDDTADALARGDGDTATGEGEATPEPESVATDVAMRWLEDFADFSEQAADGDGDPDHDVFDVTLADSPAAEALRFTGDEGAGFPEGRSPADHPEGFAQWGDPAVLDDDEDVIVVSAPLEGGWLGEDPDLDATRVALHRHAGEWLVVDWAADSPHVEGDPLATVDDVDVEVPDVAGPQHEDESEQAEPDPLTGEVEVMLTACGPPSVHGGIPVEGVAVSTFDAPVRVQIRVSADWVAQGQTPYPAGSQSLRLQVQPGESSFDDRLVRTGYEMEGQRALACEIDEVTIVE